MSGNSGNKRTIGAHVQAKAKLIISDAECKRLYGSLWKSKILFGVVKEVITSKIGKRSTTSLRVE